MLKPVESVAKSIDPRSRPIPMRLAIEVELFYAAQGAFVRDCSTTRAMEQFLIDRSKVKENLEAIASSVTVRAKLLGKTPKQVIQDFLVEAGYSNFLDASNTAYALCIAWGLDCS